MDCVCHRCRHYAPEMDFSKCRSRGIACGCEREDGLKGAKKLACTCFEKGVR